jgi:hypothetical protein
MAENLPHKPKKAEGQRRESGEMNFDGWGSATVPVAV